MLITKLILTIILYLYNPSLLFLAFVFISSKVLPFFVNDCVTQNYWSSSNNYFIKALGLVIGLVYILYQVVYKLATKSYDCVKDNSCFKKVVAPYNKLTELDNRLKELMSEKLSNLKKSILVFTVSSIKNNPEMIKKMMGDQNGVLNAEQLCNFIPDPEHMFNSNSNSSINEMNLPINLSMNLFNKMTSIKRPQISKDTLELVESDIAFVEFIKELLKDEDIRTTLDEVSKLKELETKIKSTEKKLKGFLTKNINNIRQTRLSDEVMSNSVILQDNKNTELSNFHLIDETDVVANNKKDL